MKNLNELVRPNIYALEPYHSARDEYQGEAQILLDANESPYNNPLNRYPDPLQKQLKQKLSVYKAVDPDQIFTGNGSDEAIDLAYRIFCVPGMDNAVGLRPSYGMYKVCADINGVEYRQVPLKADFSLDAQAVLQVVNPHTKLIFLCTPNNPTGRSLEAGAVEAILRSFDGIVVVDEAYSDFAQTKPWRLRINDFPNLIVLNTFSKAFSHAAIRLGMAFANPQIIDLFNKVKYPYNVNSLTAQAALRLLEAPYQIDDWTRRILRERSSLMKAVAELPYCREVLPTDANFFLARFDEPDKLYHYLLSHGIVVRNRSREHLCTGCLRITVGLPAENDQLISALRCFPDA